MNNEFQSLNEAAASLKCSSQDLLQRCVDLGIRIAVAVKELPIISAENCRETTFEGICYIDDSHLRHAVHHALEDGYQPDIPGMSVFCEGTYLRVKSLMLCCQDLVDLNRYYDHCIEVGRLLVSESDIRVLTGGGEKDVSRKNPNAIGLAENRHGKTRPPESAIKEIVHKIISKEAAGEYWHQTTESKDWLKRHPESSTTLNRLKKAVNERLSDKRANPEGPLPKQHAPRKNK